VAGHGSGRGPHPPEGLELAPGATVLVGENGSGKSTVLEVLAAALGLYSYLEANPSTSRASTSSPTVKRSWRCSVGPWGLREAAWDNHELTASYRHFLRDPGAFLRHLA
jgi:energy-coupling factor transporter ATP-binding protein EcfA2